MLSSGGSSAQRNQNPVLKAPLCFGDSLSLFHPDLGFLAASEDVKERCYLAEGTFEEPPTNFTECVFRVEPLCNYRSQNAYAKAVQAHGLSSFNFHRPPAFLTAEQVSDLRSKQLRRDAERRQNRAQREQAMGKPVTYGEGIQLVHVSSSRYLVITREVGEQDRSCSRIQLTDGSDGSHFRMDPAHRSHKLGDEVMVADTVNLTGHKFSGMHVRCTGKRYPLPDNRLEISASALPSSYSWQVFTFSSFLGPGSEKFLQSGDSIALLHQESSTHLGGAGTFDGLPEHSAVFLMADSLQVQSSNHQPNSNCFFEIEKADACSGGLISWNQLIRLRHISTGFYLRGPSGRVQLEYNRRASRPSLRHLVVRTKNPSGDSSCSLSFTADRLDDASLFLFVSNVPREGPIPLNSVLRLRHHVGGMFVGQGPSRPAADKDACLTQLLQPVPPAKNSVLADKVSGIREIVLRNEADQDDSSSKGPTLPEVGGQGSQQEKDLISRRQQLSGVPGISSTPRLDLREPDGGESLDEDIEGGFRHSASQSPSAVSARLSANNTPRVMAGDLLAVDPGSDGDGDSVGEFPTSPHGRRRSRVTFDTSDASPIGGGVSSSSPPLLSRPRKNGGHIAGTSMIRRPPGYDSAHAPSWSFSSLHSVDSDSPRSPSPTPKDTSEQSTSSDNVALMDVPEEEAVQEDPLRSGKAFLVSLSALPREQDTFFIFRIPAWYVQDMRFMGRHIFSLSSCIEEISHENGLSDSKQGETIGTLDSLLSFLSKDNGSCMLSHSLKVDSVEGSRGAVSEEPPSPRSPPLSPREGTSPSREDENQDPKAVASSSGSAEASHGGGPSASSAEPSTTFVRHISSAKIVEGRQALLRELLILDLLLKLLLVPFESGFELEDLRSTSSSERTQWITGILRRIHQLLMLSVKSHPQNKHYIAPYIKFVQLLSSYDLHSMELLREFYTDNEEALRSLSSMELELFVEIEEKFGPKQRNLSFMASVMKCQNAAVPANQYYFLQTLLRDKPNLLLRLKEQDDGHVVVAWRNHRSGEFNKVLLEDSLQFGDSFVECIRETMSLLTNMCLNRNMESVAEVANFLPFSTLLKGISSSDTPVSLKIVMMDLIRNCYLDVDPLDIIPRILTVLVFEKQASIDPLEATPGRSQDAAKRRFQQKRQASFRRISDGPMAQNLTPELLRVQSFVRDTQSGLIRELENESHFFQTSEGILMFQKRILGHDFSSMTEGKWFIKEQNAEFCVPSLLRARFPCLPLEQDWKGLLHVLAQYMSSHASIHPEHLQENRFLATILSTVSLTIDLGLFTLFSDSGAILRGILDILDIQNDHRGLGLDTLPPDSPHAMAIFRCKEACIEILDKVLDIDLNLEISAVVAAFSNKPNVSCLDECLQGHEHGVFEGIESILLQLSRSPSSLLRARSLGLLFRLHQRRGILIGLLNQVQLVTSTFKIKKFQNYLKLIVDKIKRPTLRGLLKQEDLESMLECFYFFEDELLNGIHHRWKQDTLRSLRFFFWSVEVLKSKSLWRHPRPLVETLVEEIYQVLELFVDENFENQKMAAPFLDMFIKQSRLRLDTFGLVEKIIKNNHQFCWDVTKEMVEQFVDMICHFGFDAKFLKPLQALMVVDGKPISRNQIMVFHALLRKRSQTMLLFLSPEGRARRRELMRNLTKENQQLLEYHIALIDTLSLCALGKAQSVRTLSPLPHPQVVPCTQQAPVHYSSS